MMPSVRFTGHSAFSMDSFDVPQDRHYHRVDHLWAQWDETSRRVRVGIDAMGLQSLGELAYVSLQEVGTKVGRGEPIGTLEAAKMTTPIVAPISGTVTARNTAVLEDPLRVNTHPYSGGWLVEMEPADWEQEAQDLVSGAGIPGWAASEAERFRSETN